MHRDLPDRQLVRSMFDQIAHVYDRHAVLEQEVGTRLLERLEFLRRQPRRILDLGCGTGQVSAVLNKKFRSAQIIGLDGSNAMLAQFRARSGLLKPMRAVCADMGKLPFADESVDLVFSNQAFQWNMDFDGIFAEIRRVLAPAGMFLFSTLGPASLVEMATAWLSTDERAGFRGFADILDVGNALVAAGFLEPVMDAERITLTYPDLDAVVTELEATGAAGFFHGAHDLRESMGQLESACRRFMIDDRFPLTYEVIYGLAYGPSEGQPRKTSEGDVVTFSVESLLKSRRKGA